MSTTPFERPVVAEVYMQSGIRLGDGSSSAAVRRRGPGRRRPSASAECPRPPGTAARSAPSGAVDHGRVGGFGEHISDRRWLIASTSSVPEPVLKRDHDRARFAAANRTSRIAGRLTRGSLRGRPCRAAILQDAAVRRTRSCTSANVAVLQRKVTAVRSPTPCAAFEQAGGCRERDSSAASPSGEVVFGTDARGPAPRVGYQDISARSASNFPHRDEDRGVRRVSLIKGSVAPFGPHRRGQGFPE